MLLLQACYVMMTLGYGLYALWHAFPYFTQHVCGIAPNTPANDMAKPPWLLENPQKRSLQGKPAQET